MRFPFRRWSELGFLLAPATIVEKKIGFESSWKLSHGNFWRISLALFVVTLPVTIVVLAAQFALMGRELVSVMQPERGLSLETVMTRMELVTSRHIAEIIGINLIVAPFLYGLVSGDSRLRLPDALGRNRRHESA